MEIRVGVSSSGKSSQRRTSGELEIRDFVERTARGGLIGERINSHRRFDTAFSKLTNVINLIFDKTC